MNIRTLNWSNGYITIYIPLLLNCG